MLTKESDKSSVLCHLQKIIKIENITCITTE